MRDTTDRSSFTRAKQTRADAAVRVKPLGILQFLTILRDIRYRYATGVAGYRPLHQTYTRLLPVT